MSVNSENRNSTKLSKASTYLSGEENDLVFRLIGKRCQSQCTTVAQLYQTEGPTHSRWMKKHTGALCFVKDNAKRSYYARMFCLMKHEVVWEQEMYDTIEISRVKPYLLTFEGQVKSILVGGEKSNEKRDNLHTTFQYYSMKCFNFLANVVSVRNWLLTPLFALTKFNIFPRTVWWH